LNLSIRLRQNPVAGLADHASFEKGGNVVEVLSNIVGNYPATELSINSLKLNVKILRVNFTRKGGNMDTTTVIRLGLILAVQADIEGMKAQNKVEELVNNEIIYTEIDFQAKGDQLRNLSYCHEDQL